MTAPSPDIASADAGLLADSASFTQTAARFWHPVARSADVPTTQVLAARLLGRTLAVWRDVRGEVHVVDDVCSHRGTSLATGEVTADGCLRCPYHGWLFDGDGACRRIPQLAPDRPIPPQANVASYRVSEHAGLVWTCLVGAADQLRPRPTWAVADAGTHWLHVGDVYDWAAQAFRQVENFCDVGHFSVLHVDTFGNPAMEVVEPVTVAASDAGWRLDFDYPYDAIDPMARDTPPAPMVFEYRLELPFTVALGGASGPGSVLCMAAAPLSPTQTRVFWMCAFPDGVEVDGDAYEALEARVWNPDRAIVESQRPVWLPLDLRAELHLPFDRLAVAYRRRLADIGFPVRG
jgi:phenylpropionate dioxygenase-like ring-hydroxylating dioxygenase large terminal subunit